MRIPVHIVGGFLGVGKTTALTALVASRAATERAAIVVNDFGEAGIDAARMTTEGGTTVQNIAGGCICCTAPEGLVRVLSELLDVQKPDRIYIEPSGLGRPRDVVDMLARGGVASRVDLRPVVVIVDPERLDLADPLMQEQWEGGDVLVVNRIDLASAASLEVVRASVRAKWPPFLASIETTHGVLPGALPDWTRADGPGAGDRSHDHGDHDHAHAHALPDSTDAFVARSAVLPPELTFSWDAVRRAIDLPEVVRFKGMFRSDVGWVRVDLAGGRLDVRGTPWRRDSRYDLILAAGLEDVADRVAGSIAAASVIAPSAECSVQLVDPEGNATELDRTCFERLGALAVEERVPGRVGTAVLLGSVLDLLSVPADARVVLCASDGMIAEPVARGELGDALLVYALDGGPLPEKQGGPFRVLVPGGASRCANVKGLSRIRVV